MRRAKSINETPSIECLAKQWSELVAIIEDIQDELPCYGYRRVTHELQRRGHLVNHKRVARVMRANGLGTKPRKRYVRTTDSNHDSPIYPNLYRNVIPSRPDMVWVADFTYIGIAAGFCYLAVILDTCSRKVVGYGLSKRLDTPLPDDTWPLSTQRQQ
ncbi:IS3 family transposase [Ensifer sp. ENS09]|uniref:IS3 family transposase n=1 Tax=Ensifer sp. ENS09 TaxID=2769263 RepID=UPI001780B904|nr:IS3 family transposase [Ensifer sp. ENS09]MBD9650307.1 IS3 family transposase [Ensifer sp. ENS09]